MSAAVSAALGQEVTYNHLQYGAGALSGVLDVDTAPGYDAALRAAYRALVDALGEDAERVVVYLSGRTPDGAAVTAESLGLPVQPTGRDLARRYR